MIFICSFANMNTQLLKQNKEEMKDYLKYGLLVQTLKQWIIEKLAYIPE